VKCDLDYCEFRLVSLFFVSWLFICSVNWTDIGDQLSCVGYQEMCLIVRLGVGLYQRYIGDVCTFRVFVDIHGATQKFLDDLF